MLSITNGYCTVENTFTRGRSMNLNQLRVFAAVAQTGSATLAGDRLRISQPAVSKQLSELEQNLGIALFDRLPRGMRLTDAGERLHLHAQRILGSEEAAETELAELLGLHRGRLSVGASTTIGSYLLPSLFGRFNRVHPDVELNLEIANTAVIQSAVLGNHVDLGLTEGFVSSDALDVEIVAHDEMVAVAAPNHEAAEHGAMNVVQFCGYPFIMRESGSGTRDVIEAALAERSIQVHPLMSLGGTEAVKNAVASGMGVAIVSRLTVELELEAGRLLEVRLPDFRIRRALHLLRLKGKNPSPSTSAFVALLHERRAHDGGSTE
jgi:DNA-binding transcriptional LysR family regulator